MNAMGFKDQCTAVVFCGGKATRLKNVLKGQPKALAKIGDTPYLLGLLLQLRRNSFNSVVICISPGTRVIQDAIVGWSIGDLNIQFSVDSGDGENTHALFSAIEKLTTPHIVCINGDTIVDLDFQEFFSAHAKSNAIGSLVGSMRFDQPHPGAVEVDDFGLVIDIREAEGLSTCLDSVGTFQLTNSGVYAFDLARLKALRPVLPQYGKLEVGLLRQLASGRLLYAFNNGERFLLDIGTPERLNAALRSKEIIATFFG